MLLVRIIVGAALLVLGRKLFWFFVAATGFIVAFVYASGVFEAQPNWVLLLIALGAGLLGAILAIFLQSVAIGVAGFLAGGYFLLSLLEILGMEPTRLTWLPFVIGGVIGAILAVLLFDWALIILSSLSGATLIAQGLDLARPTRVLFVAIAFGLGLLIQGAILLSEAAEPPPPPAAEEAA